MREREIIDHIAATWVRDIAPHVRRDSCILGARVVAEVLAYHGITHEVLACHAFIANDAAITLMKREVPASEWPPEAWSMGTHDEGEGGGYNGHMIVRTASGTLIDLTAKQFHRQGRINVDGPRVWDATEVEHRDNTFVVFDGGTWFAYRPNGDRSYRRARDWRQARPVAAHIIRTIKQATTEGSNQ